VEEWGRRQPEDRALPHDRTPEEALDGSAAGLPRQQRERIEDALGTMA
jgi:hypothetical protein